MIELGHHTTGEPDDGPPVLLVHALGSSAPAAVIPFLT